MTIVLPIEAVYPRDADHRYRIYARRGDELDVLACAADAGGVGAAILGLDGDEREAGHHALYERGAFGLLDAVEGRWIILPWHRPEGKVTFTQPTKEDLMPRREKVGDRIRRLRLERGLSQRDLQCPGVSYAYISRLEAGTRIPSVKALRKLAAKLGVSEDYLEHGVEVVKVTAPTSLVDAGLELWGDAGIGWSDLTDEERRQVTHGLDAALVDTLVARIHVVKITRDLAAHA